MAQDVLESARHVAALDELSVQGGIGQRRDFCLEARTMPREVRFDLRKHGVVDAS